MVHYQAVVCLRMEILLGSSCLQKNLVKMFAFVNIVVYLCNQKKAYNFDGKRTN